MRMDMKNVNVFWGLLWVLMLFGISVSKPMLINFGDSNSDTGGVLAGAGLPIGLPHGITFFHKGTGRFGDGRLIIDFFCKSTRYLFLCFLLFVVDFYLLNLVNVDF